MFTISLVQSILAGLSYDIALFAIFVGEFQPTVQPIHLAHPQQEMHGSQLPNMNVILVGYTMLQ